MCLGFGVMGMATTDYSFGLDVPVSGSLRFGAVELKLKGKAGLTV